SRQEWKFFAALPRASRPLAAAWWLALVLRGGTPAVFTIATGVLVGAAEAHSSLVAGMVMVGVSFVLLQVLAPVHQVISANLGSRLSSHLNDRLALACTAPPGTAHLEDPDLASDLVTARDFDLGMTGPPMHLNLDFIAGGLVDLASGVAAALILFGYSWWAPLVLGTGWASTHWLLRESTIWRDRNTEVVRLARRHADYMYRLAVDPPAAKELRLFGLAGWALTRFAERRRQLFELQYRATRMRERSIVASALLVSVTNLAVLLAIALSARDGHLDLARTVIFVQAGVGASLIGFGGLNWALDGAAAAVAAVDRLGTDMAPVGALVPALRPARPATGMPAREIRLRELCFSYPRATGAVFDRLDLVVPAGSSLAVVGQNGAGKTTLAKLLCRFYDPCGGAIEVDGVDLRELDTDGWRSQVAAVFQDFVRFELTLRQNVAPRGAPDDIIMEALAEAGGDNMAELGTPLSKAFPGGTDLSGGQWQRVALARAICAVRMGARLVLLDEPTAQLDVRGEAAIFDRLLAATRQVTTIVISHRFSTVRRADRICVLEHGRVVELGSHDELMAEGGRYRTMFELQASRFETLVDEEGRAYDVLG
ncbi:MAG TPA: ABC transporter ATP-binding protein, partial [Acidimicrobiales bacterium]|nr:ABC transporter ATP-binding protein [Acidimicrobiales bacterium]